jgi:hypothetical protein
LWLYYENDLGSSREVNKECNVEGDLDRVMQDIKCIWDSVEPKMQIISRLIHVVEKHSPKR